MVYVCEELEASRIRVSKANSASSHIWLKTKLRIDSEILRIVGERIAMDRFFSPTPNIYTVKIIRVYMHTLPEPHINVLYF